VLEKKKKKIRPKKTKAYQVLQNALLDVFVMGRLDLKKTSPQNPFTRSKTAAIKNNM
jgi:hypothetical protein